MQIGYIGLGNMGGALARRLSLSQELTVFDLNPSAVADLVGRGASAADSLADLAARCDTIFLCLPKSEHVRKVIWGDGGLLTSLQPGTLIVDQTSGDPKETRDMAGRLKADDFTLIDAPVSGGSSGAEAGTIAVMVGADPEQYEHILPVLHSISPNVFHAGSVGAGHTIKLVNNLLSGAQRALSLECISLAAKSGIAPIDAVRILRAGGGRNVFLESGIGPILEKGDLSGGFSLDLMHKDIDLACRIGNEHEMPMFYGAMTREVYRLAMSLVGKDPQVNHVTRAIAQITGVTLTPPDISSD